MFSVIAIHHAFNNMIDCRRNLLCSRKRQVVKQGNVDLVSTRLLGWPRLETKSHSKSVLRYITISSDQCCHPSIIVPPRNGIQFPPSYEGNPSSSSEYECPMTLCPFPAPPSTVVTAQLDYVTYSQGIIHIWERKTLNPMPKWLQKANTDTVKIDRNH